MKRKSARCRACCACCAKICGSGAGESRREGIWSVSSAWKKAFFSILGVSLLISSVVIIVYTLITMSGAGIMDIYMTTAGRILISGGAQAILIYAATDSWEATMVLANLIRQNLLEPLKERQRREGWEEGVEDGLATGRSESDAKWRAWNERREKAAASGEPFDEPPPSIDG